MLNYDDKKSKIEQLKKRLYTQNLNNVKQKIIELRKENFNVNEEWEEAPKTMMPKLKISKNFSEKMLLAAVLFFLVSVVVVFLKIFVGFGNLSPDNVEISVIGPASVESGGELSLNIEVANNNSSDLELADLLVEYPAGSVIKSEGSKSGNLLRKPLNKIPAGKKVREEVKVILFGEEGSDKDIIISLEYRMSGSNAIFFKDRKYQIRISSSPLSLVVSPLAEVVSGQEVDFSVSLISNSNTPLNNLLLSVEYPFGFEFKDADPKPTFGNNVWELSDDKNIVKIKGVITGQDEEERVFKFTSGSKSVKNEKEIDAIYAVDIKTLTIKKPFLKLDLATNGDVSKEYISKINEPVRVDVSWANLSQFKIVDAKISVKLIGDVLNKSSVSVDRGFYRSSDNTILWDKKTNGELAEIGPGESGRFSFSFSPNATSGFFVNPQISIELNGAGNRIYESDVAEEINSLVVKKIKFASDLGISARAVYYSGPFVNTGSLPPKADKETTYTIIWTITNSANNASDVEVKSSLPAYVRWMGVVSPSTEEIIYNPVGGEIIWKAGDVGAGTGISESAREVAFQVALLPSISQVGTMPELLRGISISGLDSFADIRLNFSRGGLSTRLSTDPGYSEGKGTVGK